MEFTRQQMMAVALAREVEDGKTYIIASNGYAMKNNNGEIQVVTDNDNKLIWRCPNCGNTDQTKMNVARRTCGYIGTQYWNQGRTQEIKDRVLHL